MEANQMSTLSKLAHNNRFDRFLFAFQFVALAMELGAFKNSSWL